MREHVCVGAWICDVNGGSNYGPEYSLGSILSLSLSLSLVKTEFIFRLPSLFLICIYLYASVTLHYCSA